MARAEVPDATVFIQVIRNSATWPAFQEKLASGRVWLSSVVLAELYAGTRSRDDARIIDRVASAMYQGQRLLTPSVSDWTRAGRLISRRVKLSGEMRPRDHLADVLILVSAARVKGTVVTVNLRRFDAWAKVAVAAGLDVSVTPYSS